MIGEPRGHGRRPLAILFLGNDFLHMRLQQRKRVYNFRPYRALNTTLDILTARHILTGVEFLKHIAVVNNA